MVPEPQKKKDGKAKSKADKDAPELSVEDLELVRVPLCLLETLFRIPPPRVQRRGLGGTELLCHTRRGRCRRAEWGL